VNPDRLLKSQWPNRIVLIFWIVGGVTAWFLLTRVDLIVNGTLYSYGLQFSHNWLDPYWTYNRVLNALLLVSVGLSALALALDFARSKKLVAGSTAEVSVKTPEVQVEEAKSKEDVELVVDAGEAIEEPLVEEVKAREVLVEEPKVKNGSNALIISCPSCKRVFSRPLVMLDFSAGKTRLVNVCPYCNHVLGEAEAERQKSGNDDVHVAGVDEVLQRGRRTLGGTN
jgi:hypothetical protein